jgi:branched-chain amino acid transport system substrate-binding protein
LVLVAGDSVIGSRHNLNLAGLADDVAAMRQIPVDDMMTHNAQIRDDGWVMRDLYLFRVKTPAESKAPWDYYKLLSKIPGDEAAPPRLADCKI